MFDMTIKKKYSSKSNTVKPGEYISVVKSIGQAPGYVEGAAILVEYMLTSENADLPYREYFFTSNKAYSDRSEAFFDYLAENGITALKDFVGCTERLTILKDVTAKGSKLTITKRVFLGRGDEDVGV